MKNILIKVKGVFTTIAIMFLFVALLYTCSKDIAYAATGESESNNTAATANIINTNTLITGNLSTKSDVDWFKFMVDFDGFFYVTFDHSVVDDNDYLWRIYLYDSTAINFIDENNSYFGATGKTNRTTNTFGIPAGTYYIKIIRDSEYNYSGTNYQLTVHYKSTNNWETENNNSSNKADTLMVNEIINGSLSTNGDIDWYKFTVNRNGFFNITFNHSVVNDNNSLWRIYLYDSTAVNELLRFNRLGRTESGSSDYIQLSTGKTYYIKITRISEYHYSGVPYSLIVTERHEHVGKWIEAVGPTCTVQGSEKRTCSICGQVETREIDALGHDYDEGIQTNESTIAHTGEITYNCKRCGYSFIETDKSKAWILPAIIVSSAIILFGAICFIKAMMNRI